MLRVNETEVGKPKSSVVMPKGFGKLPRTDPHYQGIQGFNFGDYPPLGGEVSNETTSNVTKGAGEAPSEDIGMSQTLEGETELGSGTAPDPKGKAKEHTAAVEGVSHIPAPVLPAEAAAAPAQQISRPSSFRGSRFSAKDMAEGEGSLKRRVTPTKGKKEIPCHDDGDDGWSEDLKTKYQRMGVQMVLGGPVTKNIRARVKLVFESDYCKDVSPEHGLVNYIFRGSFTQGLDSEFFMVHRTQGPAVYSSWAAIYRQDGLGWSPAERYSRTERQSVVPTPTQFNSLATGTDLRDEELQQFARGLVFIVSWVLRLPVYPPLIEGWTSEAKKAHLTQMEYRLNILPYVLAMAESMMAGTCPLNERSNLEHRLLVEFYWLLHKLPKYPVRTGCEDCCDKLRFMGKRKAGFQEMWITFGENSAGVQTMQRRMMLQLGHLEREGPFRLDQVWNTPNNTELNEAYLTASQNMTDILAAPIEMLQNRSQALSEELEEALRDLATGATPKTKARARRERSPSVEMVESGAKAAGKVKEGSRQQKRAREEKGSVQKSAKQTLQLPRPDYKLVSPAEWEKHKQREGAYRYDHKSWKEEVKNPWSIRGIEGRGHEGAWDPVPAHPVGGPGLPQGQRQGPGVQGLRSPSAGR
jgi:hypothetical protein